jgi:hypothetical protein
MRAATQGLDFEIARQGVATRRGRAVDTSRNDAYRGEAGAAAIRAILNFTGWASLLLFAFVMRPKRQRQTPPSA